MADDRHLGHLKDSFGLADVGSKLLEELAKGLYRPEEVIREYAQNAVDAHRLWTNQTGDEPEGPVQIEVRGDKISILDYGVGMNDVEIRRVKSISVSDKRGAEVRLTGHKGVGIWAGLSFFENITIYSTKRGVNRGYQLNINFGKIVNSISDDKDIGEVLNPNYSIDVFEADEDDHYTNVTLENPTKFREWFLDPAKVKDAIRRICPCEIDPTFVFHDEVVQWYAQNDLEIHSIEVDGQPVFRSYPSAIERFNPGSITINDSLVAVYWTAIHKSSGILSPKDDQLVAFRIIQDGFVLGENNLYSEDITGYEQLKLASYPYWYVGEIHVISADIRPDLQRRKFEESGEPARQLILKLRTWYQEAADQARVISETRSITKTYKGYEDELTRLANQGAPLTLTREDSAWLNKTKSALSEEEEQLQKYKNKKTVPYKIEALRDVKNERRRILSRIDTLLNIVVITPPETKPKSKDTKDQKGPSDLPDLDTPKEEQHPLLGADEPPHDGQGDDAPAPEPDGGNAGSTVTLEVDRSNGINNGSHQILVDVALGLLDEVLGEELPDLPDVRTRIASKLRKRILSVVSDV